MVNPAPERGRAVQKDLQMINTLIQKYRDRKKQRNAAIFRSQYFAFLRNQNGPLWLEIIKCNQDIAEIEQELTWWRDRSITSSLMKEGKYKKGFIDAAYDLVHIEGQIADLQKQNARLTNQIISLKHRCSVLWDLIVNSEMYPKYNQGVPSDFKNAS